MGMIIFFLLLAAAILILAPVIGPRVGWKLNFSKRLQNFAMAVGAVLLLVAIALSTFQGTGKSSGRVNSPTILGVTIRTSQEQGGLVYYQEVDYYDEDGNTNAVEWNLIDISDPAQRQYVEIQNKSLSDLPEIQKIRSTVIEPWYCNGRVYVATLEVSLLDRDGNRSERIRYRIDCK